MTLDQSAHTIDVVRLAGDGMEQQHGGGGVDGGDGSVDTSSGGWRPRDRIPSPPHPRPSGGCAARRIAILPLLLFGQLASTSSGTCTSAVERWQPPPSPERVPEDGAAA
eukprot:CAMPEP_0206302476 /NCGR_PEP_ID=MMETSP0106_2-20121207/8742_1 /ASSEMBLY_ACC=CAM_ASM_000206 /TAXON_ID=81532 /ORGANISM="Acanthoeca-like sp., Strain 10tr" /LENGTH=108 /DNA_ID=CAMNT_0053733243 /DNA_START=91 /DNA_END=418 /DNA_ORIENTATION=-